MNDALAVGLLVLFLSGCAVFIRGPRVPKHLQQKIRAAVAAKLALARTLYPHLPLPDEIDVVFAPLRPGRRAAAHWNFLPEWGDERPEIEDITFAADYVLSDPQHTISVTVPHEVAHLVRRMFDPYAPDDHGEYWRRVYFSLGGPPPH